MGIGLHRFHKVHSHFTIKGGLSSIMAPIMDNKSTKIDARIIALVAKCIHERKSSTETLRAFRKSINSAVLYQRYSKSVSQEYDYQIANMKQATFPSKQLTVKDIASCFKIIVNTLVLCNPYLKITFYDDREFYNNLPDECQRFHLLINIFQMSIVRRNKHSCIFPSLCISGNTSVGKTTLLSYLDEISWSLCQEMGVGSLKAVREESLIVHLDDFNLSLLLNTPQILNFTRKICRGENLIVKTYGSVYVYERFYHVILSTNQTLSSARQYAKPHNKVFVPSLIKRFVEFNFQKRNPIIDKSVFDCQPELTPAQLVLCFLILGHLVKFKSIYNRQNYFREEQLIALIYSMFIVKDKLFVDNKNVLFHKLVTDVACMLHYCDDERFTDFIQPNHVCAINDIGDDIDAIFK